MKALLAPQTAMRHHSQRGPEAAQGARQREGWRADSEERRERNARAQTEFLFYLEDGGLESADPPAALLSPDLGTVSMGNASPRSRRTSG